MKTVILIRFGELFLKGKNKMYFQNALANTVKRITNTYNCSLVRHQNRFVVQDFDVQHEQSIIEALKKVCGIHSISRALNVDTTMESLYAAASALVEFKLKNTSAQSFRVNTNRADKRFEFNSMQVSRMVGGEILSNYNQLSVNLHNPSFTVNIDMRENGTSFVYCESIMGIGGLPVGTAGRAAVLLSGGIDSPVAAFMAAKRGFSLFAVHFYSYPYTSEAAKQKVVDLARILRDYSDIRLLVVPFTEIQKNINQFCSESYTITIMRRAMFRIAERLAQKYKCSAIVTGENLGQVASQTIESIDTIESVVDMPVLRPLICFDKQQIIEVAQRIDTYNTSILPYEDCCTVFVPKNPATKPTRARSIQEEQKIKDLTTLIERAIENTEVI